LSLNRENWLLSLGTLLFEIRLRIRSNGSGKSTLAKLLSRLVNVTSGQLLINDVEVTLYDPADLRKHISILFQETGEFEGLTLAENIGIGNIDHIEDEAEIQKAATAAGANEYIEKLDFKYASYLGSIPGSWSWTQGVEMWNEDDAQDADEESDEVREMQKRVKGGLSGGELQKLGLARALMRETCADLMILDEPSAKLDPEAEIKLFETIKRVRNGRTTVFVSHRFNTVKLADQILVFDGGIIREAGTHEELMAVKDGKYQKMYRIQVEGFYPDGG
jgi:ATP-binding cassette, subfamily B, bacterial